MKGHSKIELKDVNTGELEVLEDDNMITNALNDAIAPAWEFANSPVSTGNSNTNIFKKDYIYKLLLGGILLFEKDIEEDATEYNVPAGNKMVGNASVLYANNSSVPEIGSYNGTESGIQEDGTIKLVFDFATSQANGTIKCACLTNSYFGLIGCGNESGVSLNTYGIIGYNPSTTFLNSGCESINSILTEKRYLVCRIDAKENCIYLFDEYTLRYNATYAGQHFTETGYVTVNKYSLGLTKIKLTDNSNVLMLLDSFNIEIPSDFITWYKSNGYTINYMYNKTNEKNSFLATAGNSQNSSNNGIIYVIKIDESFKATAHRLTNNTGLTLSCLYWGGCDEEEYAYFGSSTGNRIFKVKITDNTDIIEIDNSINAFYDYISRAYYKNNVFTMYGGYVLDCKSNKVLTTNEVSSASGNSQYYGAFNIANSKLSYIISVVNTCPIKTPNYLATINNLAEPVVKTADKTMKVTYTLTFSE